MTPIKPFTVSVVIPTYKRPDGLARAMASVLQQENVSFDEVEMLIVDNDPAKSAEDTVRRFGNAPVSVRYVSAPEPGVANARNAAVQAIKSDLIAFLDDDQSAPADWLSGLLSHFREFGAAVTFGPVVTVLPEDGLDHEDYLKHFFARHGPKTSCMTDEFWGCGNSLIDLRQMPKDGDLFDIAANETGGEDDYLFTKLKTAGHQFGWAADASVFEHVPLNRARLSYTLRRTFAYGQGPTGLCARRKPFDLPGVIFWTLVGVFQTTVFGAISAALFLTRSRNRAFWYDKASQGLGKVFWFSMFNQKFYGRYAA